MPGKLKITGSNLTPRDPIDVKSYCAGRQAAKDGKAAPTAGTAKTGVIASNNAIAWTANMVGQGIVVNLFNPGADNPAIDAFIAGRASWTANPSGVARDACALPYGGGYA